MAEGLIGGALLGDAVSKLSTLIKDVIKKTKHFKSKLREIQSSITIIKLIFNDITRIDEEMDRRIEEKKKFKELLEGGEDLVKKCERIRLNLWKRYRHASKLDRFKRSLVEFNQIYAPLVVIRDVREGFANMNGVDERVKDLKKTLVFHCFMIMLLVVLVSAAAGCGKTTLVTMLCNDSQIQGEFGDNIYFVTISSSLNLRVVIKSLLERNKYDNQLEFASEQVAIQQWGNFLRGNKSQVTSAISTR